MFELCQHKNTTCIFQHGVPFYPLGPPPQKKPLWPCDNIETFGDLNGKNGTPLPMLKNARGVFVYWKSSNRVGTQSGQRQAFASLSSWHVTCDCDVERESVFIFIARMCVGFYFSDSFYLSQPKLWSSRQLRLNLNLNPKIKRAENKNWISPALLFSFRPLCCRTACPSHGHCHYCGQHQTPPPFTLPLSKNTAIITPVMTLISAFFLLQVIFSCSLSHMELISKHSQKIWSENSNWVTPS